MPKKLIKIYGERNTNTNFISELIKLNLKIEELPSTSPYYIEKLQRILPGNEFIKDCYFKLNYRKNLGWKHTAVDITLLKKQEIVQNNSVYFVSITKNPYSWLLSLYKRHYHQYYKTNIDFLTFLLTPWHSVYRDNCPRSLENPMTLWNFKNRSYLKLSELNGLNITTEAILSSPENIINTISNTFSIDKKSSKFINYQRSTKDKHKDFYFYKDYYFSEKWREQLSDKAIKIINQHIDKDLMDIFGYTLIE